MTAVAYLADRSLVAERFRPDFAFPAFAFFFIPWPPLVWSSSPSLDRARRREPDGAVAHDLLAARRLDGRQEAALDRPTQPPMMLVGRTFWTF